jgi:hypothetical protein
MISSSTTCSSINDLPEIPCSAATRSKVSRRTDKSARSLRMVSSVGRNSEAPLFVNLFQSQRTFMPSCGTEASRFIRIVTEWVSRGVTLSGSIIAAGGWLMLYHATLGKSVRLHGGLTAKRLAVFPQRKMTPIGPSRHFAARRQCSRFRREADIQRTALTVPDLRARALARWRALGSLQYCMPLRRTPW